MKTILDEISSLDWDIIPKDDYKYEWVKEQIKEVKAFLENPNANEESFSHLIRQVVKDILEIDAGVIVKVFSVESFNFDEVEEMSGAPTLKPIGQRKLTEIWVRDGASFLKDIDKFGFERGYWQYSYQIPAHPMWFNRDEIVYISEQPRSMSCYGYSRTQGILDIIKSLHYSTLYNKRFFEETPIPDGVLSLLETNEVEMKSFMNYWNNEFKAQPHKVAVTNKDLKWQPFAVTNRELEFLETQKWYFNMVISSFGLTPSEMGITGDLNRATSATQAEVVKRKGIRPLLRLIENFINMEIIPEFQYDGIEFNFIYDDPAEKKTRLDNWNLELSMGIKTINEVREEMGLEPIEGGDVSNSMMSRMFAAQQQDSGMSVEEEGQSGDYKENLEREEGNNQAETKKKTKKGIDDGQYYREQPIASPIRPSGAMFQPQNEKILNKCPVCLVGDLKGITPVNEDSEDLMCGACGIRVKSQDLANIPNQEMLYNYNKEILKGINLISDNNMDIKTYCGFDISKSLPFAESYASNLGYKALLFKYLSDLKKTDITEIIKILREGLKSGSSIFQISNKINEIIQDPVRANLITRTEIIRLANEGNLSRMIAKGEKYAEWVSAPEDGRLCPKCAEKDGKIYPLASAKGMIPLHPRCRCSWTEVPDL